jgi:hypothetical protein
LSLGGADAGNYALGAASATDLADISAKSVTPVIVANDKVYDGTTAATLSAQSVTGVVGTEVVTLNVTSASFDTKDIGTGKTVTAGGLSLGGADAGNYALGAASATDLADISAKSVTLTGLTAANKVYDGNAAAVISNYGSLSGVVIGDAVTLNTSGAVASFANKNIGNGKTVTVSGLALNGAGASNYSIGNQATTADIGAKELTLVGLAAANKVYDGTAIATITSYGNLTGVVGGEAVTLDTDGAAASFGNRAVGTGKVVTVTWLALEGADAGNYSIANQTTTADITAKSLSLTGLAAANKVYDGTLTAIISNLGTLTGVVVGDAVTLNTSGASATFASKTVENGKTVTVSGLSLSGADAGNYSIANQTATADITAKALTLTGLTATTKTYDGTAAATIANYGTLTAVVLGDNVALDTGGATAVFENKNVASGKTVTVSGLSLSGTDAGNYSIANQTTTADITAKALTLAGLAVSNKIYDGTTSATISTLGTLSGVVSGDTATLNSAGAAATFGSETVGTAKTVTVSGLSLDGTDAGNYSIANQTTTADITAKALTLAGLTANSKIYDGTASATISNLGTLTGVVLGDNVTLNTSGAVSVFADKNVGVGKTVTLSGLALGGGDAGNYAMGNQTTAADITAKNATVKANDWIKTYGDTVTFSGVEFTASGFVPGDSVTSVTLTSGGAPAAAGVGDYPIVPSAAQGTGVSNYNISYSNGTLSVGKAVVTATADDLARPVGEANPPLTIRYSGFVNGEGVGALDSLPTASTAATVNSPAGAYPITLTGGADNNYEIVLVDGILTVTNTLQPFILSITANEGAAAITWSSIAGRTYRVQYKNNLTDANWTDLSPDVTATGVTASKTDNVGTQPRRFYQVVLLP